MRDPGEKRVAIVGATGAVGRTIVQVLGERRFPVGHLVPIATGSGEHKEIEAFGRSWPVLPVGESDFAGLDVAFFTAGAAVSAQLVPQALDQGCRVVDNTTAFRMAGDVPLVIPEINASEIGPDTRLAACPNCTAIVLAMSLAPIHAAVPVMRVVVTSFQSVSGAGREALEELDAQIDADRRGEAIRPNVFPGQIAFNCLPIIGGVLESGYTNEEQKIMEEIQKIFGRPDLGVVATAVRVPTRVGHGVAVNVELGAPLTTDDAAALWRDARGVAYTDGVPTPADVAGTDTVVIGRMRRDPTRPHAITYWAVGDNLRKGAATNSVQIAELFSP
ncbi:MAG: aspartate-semialdehyde dehydrogenase [bacterium]